MKMIEYLDQDKERVMTGLRGASTPEDAKQVLEKEADRLLLQYNESCSSLRVRDTASGMMQAVRSSVPFLDSMGEARVWRREGSGGKQSAARGGNLSAILLGIGAALIAAAFLLPALLSGGTSAAPSLLRGLLPLVAGGGCLYLSGRTAGKNASLRIGNGGGWGTGEEQIEITIDPDKLWSSLRGVIMVVDRSLDAAQEEEAYARQKKLSAAEGGLGIGPEEIELFSGLLEMADADSPQMAADIRYYLHKKDVEAVDWSLQYAAWFEMLPTVPGSGPARDISAGGEEKGAVTVRPALVQGGKLLKKGIAVK